MIDSATMGVVLLIGFGIVGIVAAWSLWQSLR